MATQHKMDYGRLVQTIENVKKHNKIDSTKIADFFIHYVSGNSYAKSAEVAGLNVATAKLWRHEEWFTEVIQAARAVVGQVLDRKLSKIIDMALGNVQNRLIKGDPFKNGSEVDYKPVTAKDSALIAAICFDKRALSRGEPNTINATTSVSDKLETLGEAFEKIAKGAPDLKVVEK